MSDPLYVRILTIIAGGVCGAMMGGLVSFWNTRLQDFLRRRGLHNRLAFIPTAPHQNKVAVDILVAFRAFRGTFFQADSGENGEFYRDARWRLLRR